MEFARLHFLDGHCEEVALRREGELLTLASAPDFSQVRYVDFLPDYFDAPAGTEGYYVFPSGVHGTWLCRLKPRADCEYFTSCAVPLLPVVGGFLPGHCTAMVVEGGKFSVTFVVCVKKGRYSMFPRFVLEGIAPEEPLAVRCHALPLGSDYSDLAKWYRARRLGEDCVPLRERVKTNPALRYAVESPEIRIRLGWKPAPSPVLEQTLDNEPPMHVACDFAKVGELVEEFHRQGVDKAEFCLVGWNVKGHDGRWPQIFPVEEALGGEEALRKLIADVQAKGYQMVCHTNSTDCYHIAEDFTEEYVRKDQNGALCKNAVWSGGQMYDLCYRRALEFAQRDLPRVAGLGFRGLHYIDVIGVVPPHACFDPRHPVTLREGAELANRIADTAGALFGGFSSEGAYDFICGHLDYGLYVSMGKRISTNPLFDENIPLWQLVFHGIVLSNPSVETINYPVKGEPERLHLLEYGGRPSIYFYSKFMAGNAWMGQEDFLCDTPEQMRESVAKIKNAYDEYQSLLPLQYEFMEQHEILPDGTRKTTYSDGSVLTVNYQNNTFALQKGTAFDKT